MDAQIDYLDWELRNAYASVRRVVLDTSVTVDAASDEVVYSFEVPGAILGGNGRKFPRDNAQVQEVFTKRRADSNRALRALLGQSSLLTVSCVAGRPGSDRVKTIVSPSGE